MNNFGSSWFRRVFKSEKMGDIGQAQPENKGVN